MTRDCDKPLLSIKIVRWSSVWLMTSWSFFLVFICLTDIDKQSVYLGKITFYGAMLYLNTLLVGLPLIAAWSRLACLRHPLLKRSTLWGGSTLLVMACIHAITQTIIMDAIG